MKIIQIRCDFCGREVEDAYSFRIKRFLLSLILKPILTFVHIKTWDNKDTKFDLCEGCYNSLKDTLANRNTVTELRELYREQQRGGRRHIPYPEFEVPTARPGRLITRRIEEQRPIDPAYHDWAQESLSAAGVDEIEPIGNEHVETDRQDDLPTSQTGTANGR